MHKCACLEKFDVTDVEKVWIKAQPVTVTFDCNVCGKQFLTKKKLSRHSLNHKKTCEHIIKMPLEIVDKTTNRTKYQCPNCDKIFADRGQMNRHISSHRCNCAKGIAPIKKKIEDLPDELKPIKEVQESDENTNVKLSCPKCPGKSWRDNTRYINHIKTVHNDTKFECPYCFETVASVKTLKGHMQRHLEPSPREQCPFCGKFFVFIKMHIRYHHAEKPFKCTHCPKAYATKNLRRCHFRESHVKLQMRELCNVCGLRCHSKSTLRVHMMTHTNEKPFSCDICNKGFQTNRKMEVHRYIHTGERPHPCDYCDRSFRARYLLIKHIRTRHTDTPYECPYEECDLSFSQMKQCKDHYAKMHKTSDEVIL